MERAESNSTNKPAKPVMDPYIQSSSFFDLLTSQQPNQYESYPPSMGLGSSEVPLFSTQCTDVPTLDEGKPKERFSRRKWTPTEDVVLITAWLNISKDAIVSNDQKLGHFWERITAYYCASPKLAGMEKRELSHCKQRWQKINDHVNKFVGSYEAATKAKASGQNEDDVMKLAYEIFFDDYKVKFTLEHAWRELRHDQKWCGSLTKGTTKRRKGNDGSATSAGISLGEEDSLTRHIGVKAAKGKRKKTNKNTSNVDEWKVFLEFQMKELARMYEMKQNDFALTEKAFALKEKQSKHSMLDYLLAKTEPLTETEKTLKDKLINDMLSP